MPTPDYDPNATRVPAMMTIVWLESVIAVALISLRFHYRMQKKALGIDDWTMLLSVLLFVLASCVVTYLASVGGFRHFESLSPEQQYLNVKWNWISQPFVLINFGLSKLAVALLIDRLLIPTDKIRRGILYAVVVLTMLLTVFGVIFVFGHCSPPRALWTPGLTSAKCWTGDQYNAWVMTQGAWFIFVDFFLAIFPATMIWNLQLSLRKRIGICCLLGLGVIAGIVGCIKMPTLRELGAKSDLTWEMFPLFAYTISEIALVIYAGCIPTLRPLSDRFVGTQVSKKSSAAYSPFIHRKSSSIGSGSTNDKIIVDRTYEVESQDFSDADSRFNNNPFTVTSHR